jgi:rhamnosyltransferase subunit B
MTHLRGNFLLTPIGSGGDVHPYVGLGIELKRRGHRVRILTSEPFRDTVEAAGLEFVPVISRELYDEGSSHPDLWHPQKGLKIVLELARRSFEPVWEALATRFTGSDTVVVSHALAFGARAFQLKHAPWSPTVHLAPCVFRSSYRQPIFPPNLDVNALPRFAKRAMWWAAERVIVDPAVRPWLDEALAARGIPAVEDFFEGWLHSEALTLGLFPSWFGDPQPDWPASHRLTSFPLFDGSAEASLSPETEAFLAEGPPPVLFTAGTANRDAADFLRTSIEAAEMAGLRSILATAFDAQLPRPLPASALGIAYEPFRALLPRCAAIVHHGGIGTTSQGLRAGLPQIVRPLGFDQADNGDRLRRLGVGSVVLPREYRTKGVARALRELTEDAEVRRRAARLSERVSGESGIRDAVDLIEGTLPGDTLPIGPRPTPARETGPARRP